MLRHIVLNIPMRDVGGFIEVRLNYNQALPGTSVLSRIFKGSSFIHAIHGHPDKAQPQKFLNPLDMIRSLLLLRMPTTN